MRSFRIIVATFLLSACGHGERVPSDTKSSLSLRDAYRAFRAAERAVDYLPFGYIADGCYARAYYMAMEAAVDGLPVSVQYVYMPTGYVSPDGVIRWNYHAATMVWIDDADQPSILDPAFFDGPAERSEWVDRLRPTEVPELRYATGSNFIFSGSHHRTGPRRPAELSRSLSSERFTAMDVSSACAFMSSYINSEPGLTSRQRMDKADRMMARTKEIFRELTDRGLTVGGPLSTSPSSCY